MAVRPTCAKPAKAAATSSARKLPSLSGGDIATKAPANAAAARVGRVEPTVRPARRPIREAEKTGLVVRATSCLSTSASILSSPCIRGTPRAHPRITAAPSTVASTATPAAGRAAASAAAAASSGRYSSPARRSDGVTAMLTRAESVAAAPRRPPYPLRKREFVASSVDRIAPAPAPSAPACTAPGATTAVLIPQKEPQKAAVASGAGSAKPAARPTREDATTAPQPAACTSSHVATAPIADAAMRVVAVRTTTPVPGEADILRGPYVLRGPTPLVQPP
mmetsp:Transcript_24111/g.46697  ORF Transcript_24111/g.46697 Transcript_24111/m.46697 type:complete len:279 (-) Transcript_24111:317-1153(-)